MKRIFSEDEVCMALRAYSLERDRLMTSLARCTGISAAEFNALDVMEAAGGQITPGELATRLSLSSGAVTALGDRLERAGWIERAAHPQDRRSVVMRLTPEALETGRRLLGSFPGDVDALARSLDPPERAAIMAFLGSAAELAARQADSSASSSAGSVTGRRQAKLSQT